MAKRIAIIGAGISGIAAANILQKNGHSVVVYEKSDKIGGVWAVAYPEVRLQNTWHQYGLADFPWSFTPDLHPTAAQILRYLDEAVQALNINVCTSHEVIAMSERPDGWDIQVHHAGNTETVSYDYVVLASGQYTEGKYLPKFPEQESYQGKIITERDVKDLEIFRGKQVIVVGFGKSALDMAVLAVSHGAVVQHVFRTARWTIPRKLMGLHFAKILFSRFGSVMMTSWAQPTAWERFLHSKLAFVVNSFWSMISQVFWMQLSAPGRGKGTDAQKRLDVVKPSHPLLPDLRSAAALAPDDYYRYVVEGKITPCQGLVERFTPEGIQLADKRSLAADMVVLSLGSMTPRYPYLPSPYREMLEAEDDGVQLYRHLVHPRIPNMGFAGFNHGFLHIPSVEVGTVWLCALLDGQLQLPGVEAMEASIERVRQWKRHYIHFEPSRSMAVNTRYQQYLDILLKDLKINPYRKGINLLAETFMPYGSADYRQILHEYQQRKSASPALLPLELDT